MPPRAPTQMEFSGGLDLKLRLLREGPHWPEISAGAHGLFDSRGLGGQYLMMSRRWYDTDWTLGVGWGRFAQQGFLGYNFSPIGGVEIHLPADGPFSGVSLKVEYTGDRFRAERSRYADLPAPFPVNAGIVWRPLPWIEAGAAFEQGHAAMLRASLMLDAGRLDSGAPAKSPPQTIGARPNAFKSRATRSAAFRRLCTPPACRSRPSGSTTIRRRSGSTVCRMARRPGRRDGWRGSWPRASPASIERLTVVLGPAELAGSAVSFLRADLERADRHAGSPAEIWRTAELDPGVFRRRCSGPGGGPLAGPDHSPAGAVFKRTNRLLRLPDNARLRDGEHGVQRLRQWRRTAVQSGGQS